MREKVSAVAGEEKSERNKKSYRQRGSWGREMADAPKTEGEGAAAESNTAEVRAGRKDQITAEEKRRRPGPKENKYNESQLNSTRT